MQKRMMKTPKRLDVLIALVKTGRPRTQKELAAGIAKKVPQTAKQVMGLVSQCVRFGVGIGGLTVDDDGRYKKVK